MRVSRLAAAMIAAPMAIGMFASAMAEDLADKAIGVWLRENKGWHVEFSLCGDKLCGEVISGEGVDKKTGESVIGVKMLYDLEKDGEDSWVGKMYNPGDGNEYKGKVKVLSENEIKMSGCLLGGLICRSEKWPRVEEAMADDAEEMMDDAEDSMEDAADAMEDAADAMEDADDAMDAAEDAMEEATGDN